MNRPSVRNLFIGIAVVAVAASAVYKFKFAPVPMVAYTVERGEIAAEVMGTGTLEARIKTTVSARIQERLVEVLADQGDLVTGGQLLARLDDAESKQQVAIAVATLEAARQTKTRVSADLARAEAVLVQARVQQARMAGLLPTHAVSELEAETATEALRVAEADLKRSNAAILEAEGQIIVAEKNLLFREEQLAFTEIHSPYDGLIIRRDRDVGDVLVPGASLMELISLDELWVSAWIDETAMRELAADQPALLVFRSEPDSSYAGKVARLGREMDRETREFLVEVLASELPKNWTIGQRAEVFIETSRQADALLLPRTFLVWHAEQPGVFVHMDGRARWRGITPGLQGKEDIAITEGLEAGEQILRLPDGQKGTIADGQRISLP